MKEQFLKDSGALYPIIGGPMYPCSNALLVASVSNAGGIGIIQPITLTYVEGYDFREGIQYIKSLTDRPIGMNVLIEESSAKYKKKMSDWIEIALDEGIRFFITSLGKPEWVVHKVHPYGAKVYHDVTEVKWAKKALKSGVDGLIAVNHRAGGHAGERNLLQLAEELKAYKIPIICAGGISDSESYKSALNLGYSGVQMGTRFIASIECSASDDYKEAIVNASEKDIILTRNITGIPVSVINTSYMKELGVEPSSFASWMLAHAKLKYFMRILYMLKSLRGLKNALHAKKGQNEFWQAGKSVQGIIEVLSVEEIIDALVRE